MVQTQFDPTKDQSKTKKQTNKQTKPTTTKTVIRDCEIIYLLLSNAIWKNLNPLTPRSDQHQISLYNINTLSSREVMRITKIIN